MRYTIEMTRDEVAAMRSLFEWADRNAPHEMPMRPETRAGRMLLNRTKAVREAWPETPPEEPNAPAPVAAPKVDHSVRPPLVTEDGEVPARGRK